MTFTRRHRVTPWSQTAAEAPEPRATGEAAATWPGPHLPGVGAGVDTQEARVLVAVVVGGRVVHPVVPAGTGEREAGKVAPRPDGPRLGLGRRDSEGRAPHTC